MSYLVCEDYRGEKKAFPIDHKSAPLSFHQPTVQISQCNDPAIKNKLNQSILVVCGSPGQPVWELICLPEKMQVVDDIADLGKLLPVLPPAE